MRMKSHLNTVNHAILVLFGLITFYPFVFIILTSFKSSYQISHSFWALPWPLQMSNYRDAWKMLSDYFINSIFVTTTTVTGVLAVASLSAFTFARYRFPGREFLFMLIISLMMLPAILLLVPQFLLVKRLGLLNTRWALVLPYISGGQVFAIFVLRSFMATIPEELFEAGTMDGVSRFQAYQHIAVPLSRPTLATIAILNILYTWNDYVWPLVTISRNKLWTISVGIMSFAFTTSSMESRGIMFAGYVLASLPLVLLFLFTMRAFVKGLTSGALKV